MSGQRRRANRRRRAVVIALMVVALVSACTGGHPRLAPPLQSPSQVALTYPPLIIDDTNLLPAPRPLGDPASSPADASQRAAALLQIINSQGDGHLQAVETAMRESGISIYNGGNPEVLIAAGRGSTATWTPAAAVLATDVGAGRDERIPLNALVEVFAAELSDASNDPAATSAVRTWLADLITMDTSPAGLVRAALLDGDGGQPGTLLDAVHNGTDYPMTALQVNLLMPTMRTSAMEVAGDIVLRQAAASPSAMQPATAPRPTPQPAPAVAKQNGANCVLDTWPDAIWTGLASTVGALQGTKLVTAITDTIMKLGQLAEKFEEAVARTLGVAGLASDVVSLVMSMANFDATLTNTQPFERTPHTGDPGGTTTLFATLTQGAASKSGLLNCVLRIVGAPFGIDASKFTGGPINNALVGFSLVGNPPATLGGQGTRTDESGVAHATLTGDPQLIDKTGQPTYNRGVGVRVVVHPATKDGTSATGAVANALFGDAFAVLGGNVTKGFVDWITKVGTFKSGFNAALKGLTFWIGVADASVKAFGQLYDLIGMYQKTFTVNMLDYGNLQLHVAIQADFVSYDDKSDSAFCQEQCDLKLRGTYRVEGSAPVQTGSASTMSVPLDWVTDTVSGSFGGISEGLSVEGSAYRDPFKFAITTSHTAPGTAQVALSMAGDTVTSAQVTVDGVQVQEDWREITHTTFGPTPPSLGAFMNYFAQTDAFDGATVTTQTGPWPNASFPGNVIAQIVLHPKSQVPGIVWTEELSLQVVG